MKPQIAKSKFEFNELITLKDKDWLVKQKHAGNCANNVLAACSKAIKSVSKLSLKDLEQIALDVIKENDCEPTFKNYRGFPSAICTSVNKQLVHGIVTDYILQRGDFITVDVGVTYNRVIADTARTWIYGDSLDKKHELLIRAGQEALDVAIKSIEIGKRVGEIGFAISKHVSKFNFGLIIDYGGHGLDYDKPHADPFVINRAKQNEGARIVNGMTLAIEPMLTTGWDGPKQTVKTNVLDDSWTVVTKYLSCHFEDTITIMNDIVHRITGDFNEN